MGRPGSAGALSAPAQADDAIRAAVSAAAEELERAPRPLRALREEDLRQALLRFLRRSSPLSVAHERSLPLKGFRGVGGFDLLFDRRPGADPAWLAETKWSYTPQAHRAPPALLPWWCFACGFVLGIERAHIAPRAAGGSNDVGNLHLLCHECHGESETLRGAAYWRWLMAHRWGPNPRHARGLGEDVGGARRALLIVGRANSGTRLLRPGSDPPLSPGPETQRAERRDAGLGRQLTVNPTN